MNKIKKQILDLRQTTPKHIQWLLLVAAFIVVLILLTLLLGGRPKNNGININDEAVDLIIVPDTEINFEDTITGTTKDQEIKINASSPVKVIGVQLDPETPDLTFKQNCTSGGDIDTQHSCTVSLMYKPTNDMENTIVNLSVDWRDKDYPDMMKKTENIVIRVGAISETAPAATTEPKPVAAPVVEPIDEPDDTPIIEPDPIFPAPAPIVDDAPIDDEPDEEPAIAPEPIFTAPAPVAEPLPQPVSENCSDFAFPGYDMAGVQIGWIKPERGAYYFHPFSDKECKKPTGVYNADTGVITAIGQSSKKIGTDAEHIGRATFDAGVIPQLTSRPKRAATDGPAEHKPSGGMTGKTSLSELRDKLKEGSDEVIWGTSGASVYSTDPYDRTFVLRQYKPIPATIVSEVRADPALYNENGSGDIKLPIRATVDRNVYSDNGRTVVVPTGTMLMGYLTGELPGPYKAIGRMDIQWYQFILPNGVEFNFGDTNAPFSGDSQGRQGVPGHGSTDYIQQMVMPMLTAIVPAAVNMIAPIADKFVNQIDLDNNTVVQSGTVRSSELAKNEVINAWNQVAQKLMVDMLDNTVPPFSIAAGTRITVYSPDDLVITCGKNHSKKCSVDTLNKPEKKRREWQHNVTVDYNNPKAGWIGQARSFELGRESCKCDDDAKGGACHADPTKASEYKEKGYDYTTVEFFCQTLSYNAINNAKHAAVFENQYDTENKNSFAYINSQGPEEYNKQVLGLEYDEDTGAIVNPFNQPAPEPEAALLCGDGTAPDANGCCTGEIYTDMGEQGFNCCPESGGDCFPPYDI